MSPARPNDPYDPEAIRTAIRAVLDAKGLKPSTWAKAAGISDATLRKFLAGGSNSLEVSTAIRLAAEAGVTINEMLGLPGTPSSSPEPSMHPQQSVLVKQKLEELRGQALRTRKALLRQIEALDGAFAEASASLSIAEELLSDDPKES